MEVDFEDLEMKFLQRVILEMSLVVDHFQVVEIVLFPLAQELFDGFQVGLIRGLLEQSTQVLIEVQVVFALNGLEEVVEFAHFEVLSLEITHFVPYHLLLADCGLHGSTEGHLSLRKGIPGGFEELP